MKIRVISVYVHVYDDIEKYYGNILKNFGLCRDENEAYVVLNTIEEIKELDLALEQYIQEYEGDCNWLRSACYQGVRFMHDDGEFILLIVDDFD